MKSIKTMLSSPKKIALFATCAVLIIGIIAFSVLYSVGAISNNQGIGLEKATNVALKDAGFGESEVTGLRGHYDREDNLKVYEIEFYADGFEYDYVISADNGTILESNRERTVQNPGIPYEDDSSQHQSDDNAPDNNSQDLQPDTKPQQPDSQSQQQTSKPQTDSQYIGTDRAKEIALSHSGVSASSATFTKTKLDRDDGMYLYEIEFHAGNLEYEYEINALTGDVVKFETESIYD